MKLLYTTFWMMLLSCCPPSTLAQSGPTDMPEDSTVPCAFCGEAGVRAELADVILDADEDLTCMGLESLAPMLDSVTCATLDAARQLCCDGGNPSTNYCPFVVAPGFGDVAFDVGENITADDSQFTCALIGFAALTIEANTTDCDDLQPFAPLCDGSVNLTTYECPYCPLADLAFPDRIIDPTVGVTCEELFVEFESPLFCFFTADNQFTLVDIDIAAYCGCPDVAAPELLCDVCSDGLVPTNLDVPIPIQSNFTCAEGLTYAQFVTSDEHCAADVLEIAPYCCGEAPSAAPSVVASAQPSAVEIAIDSPPVETEAPVGTVIDSPPVETEAPVAAPTSASAITSASALSWGSGVLSVVVMMVAAVVAVVV